MKTIKQIILEDIESDIKTQSEKIIKTIEEYLQNKNLKDDYESLNQIIDYIKSNQMEHAYNLVRKVGGYTNLAMDLKDLKDDYEILSNPKYNKDWGLKPGKYIVWRAGTIDGKMERGIFTSIDEEGAKFYLDSENPNRTLHSYYATIKHPFVCERVENAYSILSGTSFKDIMAKRDRTKDNIKWLRDIDKKVFNLAKKKGYDAITYTRPSPPAIKEMVLFNKNQLELIK